MFFNSKKNFALDSRPPVTIFQVQPCEKKNYMEGGGGGGAARLPIRLACPPMSPFGKPCINYTLHKYATKIS